jgi:hypothetical protein
MRTTIAIAVSTLLGATLTPAEAVVLNPHGTGQVLIYPYYTVNAGFGTLLSLVNTTDQGKALKVRIREGYNGRGVLDFNLYLSPFDAWVAQIFDTSSDGSGGAAIATNDNSCTVPAFPKTLGPVPGSGPGVESFGDIGYTGANADGGPIGITRTREGYLEIIEMGTVTNDHQSTLNAVTHGSSGVPSSCAQVAGAWMPGGYWTTDATADINVPTGGLYGAESIINVGEGLMYTVNAQAIDGFSSAAQHTPPDSSVPDLSSAGKSADGTVSAFVPVGAGMVEAKFANPEDAISALFMVDNLYNEYVVDAGLNAASDWIVTFPTKRFYVDPSLVGDAAARAPFDLAFGAASAGTSCVPIGRHIIDREGAESAAGDCGFICPTLPATALCYTTNAIQFGATPALNSNLTYFAMLFDHVFGPGAGHVRIDFTKDDLGNAQPNHVLTSANGVALDGLPATGFLALEYVNGNVTPGTLANYSGATAHRSSVSCTRGSGPPVACP